MRQPDRQRGLSGISLMFLLGFIALVAIIVVKCLPLYLNQLKVARTMHGVAEDLDLAAADSVVVRERIKARWIIEDIDYLTPNDVKIKRTDAGRELIYDYEARAELFYNISVVVHFFDNVPMRKAPGID